MTILHYSTINGERTGRASSFYHDTRKAIKKINGQNHKAEEMGIQTRYDIAYCDSKDVDPKHIR